MIVTDIIKFRDSIGNHIFFDYDIKNFGTHGLKGFDEDIQIYLLR